MENKVIHRLDNKEDGVSVTLIEIQNGFLMTLMDDDAAEVVGTRSFTDRVEAEAYMARCVHAAADFTSSWRDNYWDLKDHPH